MSLWLTSWLQRGERSGLTWQQHPCMETWNTCCWHIFSFPPINAYSAAAEAVLFSCWLYCTHFFTERVHTLQLIVCGLSLTLADSPFVQIPLNPSLTTWAGLGWNRHTLCKESSDAGKTHREEDEGKGVWERGWVWVRVRLELHPRSWVLTRLAG